MTFMAPITAPNIMVLVAANAIKFRCVSLSLRDRSAVGMKTRKIRRGLADLAFSVHVLRVGLLKSCLRWAVTGGECECGCDCWGGGKLSGTTSRRNKIPKTRIA